MNDTYSSYLPFAPSRAEEKSTHLPFQSLLGEQFTPDGFRCSYYHQRSIIYDHVVSILIILQFALLHCYFQWDIDANYDSRKWLFASTFCGLGTEGILILRFKIRNEYLYQIRQKPYPLWALLFNLGITLIMPYPFLQGLQVPYKNIHNTDEVLYFKVNYILAVLSCIRFVPPSEAIINISKYMRPRAYRLSKMTGSDTHFLFGLRAIFKEKPFEFIVTSIVVSIYMFAFSFRIAEYQFLSESTVTAYLNVTWMTVITMSTVGFGDMTPATPLGRIVTVICTVWGVFVIAVMLGVLTQILSLNRRQVESLMIMKRLEMKSKLKVVAGQYLRVSLWRVWRNYKTKENRVADLKERKSKSEFRRLRQTREFKTSNFPQICLETEMSREFQRANTNIEYLINNNLSMINYLSEKLVFSGGRTFELYQKYH